VVIAAECEAARSIEWTTNQGAMIKARPPQGGEALAGLFKLLGVANVVVAVILTGAAFYALRRILEPLVLAVFLLIVMDSLARAMARRVTVLRNWMALTVAFVLIVGVLGLTLWLSAANAADFATQAPAYSARIDALLLAAAQRFGLSATPTTASLLGDLNPARFAGILASGFSHFLEGAVFVLVYLGFLLASRRGFATKLGELFRGEDERAEAVRVFGRIRHGVESYIWVQTVVGVIITAASAVIMTVCGLSHVAFWCVIIFMANYIPAIGAAIGVLFPALFGLVEFDSFTRTIALVAGLEATHFVVSHVIQPRMQGRSLNLDPIVVLLALAFWGAVWGTVGAFLSTPLTVALMAILAEFKPSRPIAVLLSSDGKPYADLGA
jgi:AI-2 transport protein TqsA